MSLSRLTLLGISLAMAAGACGSHAVDDATTTPNTDPDGGTKPNFAMDHPRIYLAKNRDRLKASLDAKSPAAIRFKGAAEDWVAGSDVYAFRSWYAALLGQVTGNASYCAAAITAVDKVVADDEAKIAAGTPTVIAGDSYLQVGPMVGDVMLTYDWCFPTVTDGQKSRWLAYANQAVWNVWHHADAKWGSKATPWDGWATDNPSDNYFYSFLRATMLLGLAAHGELPDADGWLTQFHDTELMNTLVPKFEQDLKGGGSREGTGYGVSMRGLFELYDIWQASTGEDLATKTGHTRASMLSFLHSVVPTLDRVAPTGDHSRDSTAALFDYERNYLRTLGHLFPKDPVTPRALYLMSHSSVPEMGQPFMYIYDFLYDLPDVVEQAPDTLGRAYFASGTGQLYARSGWDKDATWVNMIAGPYTETHAHQDQGALVIYKGGWLAYDPVIDSHSGLPQQVEAHNVVRIVADGKTVEQKIPTASLMTALHRGDGWLHAAADLTSAYAGVAAVTKVQRELVYLEPDCVVVFDRVDTAAGTKQVWQLNAPRTPTIAGARSTVAGGPHALNVDRILPAGAAATVFDWKTDMDFTAGARLDETIDGGSVVHLHVLSLDGTVSSVAASDAGGRKGVTVTFADGSSATVRFGATSVDGTLDRKAVGGAMTSVPLGVGVDSLPE